MLSNQERSGEAGLVQLPAAVLETIMMKLDVGSICTMASTCKTCKSCASYILSFLPSFHLYDIALTTDSLRLLLPENHHLKSLKADCNMLDDTAINMLTKPSLHELFLKNCMGFSGKLLEEIGEHCRDLRSLYLGSVAENSGQMIHISHIGKLIMHCTRLEALMLMFDFDLIYPQLDAAEWSVASHRLASLEINHVSSLAVIQMLTYRNGRVPCQSPLPNIQKLCLTVDHITDSMVSIISEVLTSLRHLELRDAPFVDPPVASDLTDVGIRKINQHGKLKHLSIVRTQELLCTYFNHVTDLGFLLMAERCTNMESICLGGFSRVTDTGFKTLLHSCSKLYKFRIFQGTQITDLVFHDISLTSLSLTHVSLRWCRLLSNYAIVNLVANSDLKILDLRECKNIGDESLRAIGNLQKLKVLLLDGTDVSDFGLSSLRNGVISSLVSLSIRRCKRVTDTCLSVLFEGTCHLELQELDLSHLPNISHNGILTLARNRVPISILRLRRCPLIGDAAVMTLASMRIHDEGWHGSRLRLLDLYECGGITALAFRWLKKPYFPRLICLGVTVSVNRNLVDALERNRPSLHVAGHGEELSTDIFRPCEITGSHDYLASGIHSDSGSDEEVIVGV